MTGFLARLSRSVLGTRGKDVASKSGDPKSVALAARGLTLLRDGRHAEADVLYRRTLASDPSNFDALHMLGVIAQQMGDSARAVEFMLRAIDIAPGNVAVRIDLGIVYLMCERFAEAEISIRKAIAMHPEEDRAHANLGTVLRTRGDFVGAEGAFAAALRLNPANYEALNNLANLYGETRRYDEAETLYQRALAIRPQAAEVWNALGTMHLALERFQDAERSFRSALDFDETSADAHSNLGFALLQMDRVEEAERACRDALALNADLTDALVNLSSVLRRVGDQGGAEQGLVSALMVDTRHVSAHINLGSLYMEKGDIVAAETSFRDALRLDEQSPAARYNLAILRLMQGDYREGFALFESRFGAFPRESRNLRIAALAAREKDRWHGEPLAGRRILVWTEQGYGDSLMMLRYLPMLAARGAGEVSVLCDSTLERIFQATPGVDRVLTGNWSPAIGGFDVHCPIMSLPHHFATTADTVPAKMPLFTLPPTLAQTWRQHLSGICQKRIGLAWAGNPMLRDDAKRSIPLAAYEPLRAISGIQFVSLQKDDAADDAASWNTMFVDPIAACADFLDTAALVDTLDLVITVDTAVAHLAGALGKPVWLLNRFGSEWRWGAIGESTPWYPTMTIYRQADLNSWDSVIADVTAALKLLEADATR